jgi:hypothetical protein
MALYKFCPQENPPVLYRSVYTMKTKKIGRPSVNKVKVLFFIRPTTNQLIDRLAKDEWRKRSEIVELAVLAYSKGSMIKLN